MKGLAPWDVGLYHSSGGTGELIHPAESPDAVGKKSRVYGNLGVGSGAPSLIEPVPLMVQVNAPDYNRLTVFHGLTGNRVVVADLAGETGR